MRKYRKRLDEILEIVGLTERRKYTPRRLSGGQQQDMITKAESDLKAKKKQLELQKELLAEGAGAEEDVNTL